MAVFSEKINTGIKFKCQDEVRIKGTNSRSPTYEVLKVRTCTGTFRYSECIIVNTKDLQDVRIETCLNLKLASDVCEYEVYGDKMVGRTVKEVTYNQEGLHIVFEDGYEASYEVEGDGHSSLEFTNV